MTFNPEQWLESLMRELKKYVGNGLNNSVKDNNGNSVGLYNPTTNGNGVYELVMEFPTPESMRNKVPLPRTIIHFEVDSIRLRPVGLGQRIIRQNYDPQTKTVAPQEAAWVQVNFDVGIWSSDRSGGTTARMRALQTLGVLFQGTLAQKAFDKSAVDYTNDDGDGRIEIIDFTGGRFITETINDVVTYRVVEGSLELRVFSRTPLFATPTAPAIEEILQDPHLMIAE